ncbi:MAG: O-antigen translocase [Flavobacteriaceae bacterium]|nr:O-antigen translocase [Flavobacteriaceae bacterium]
MSFIKTSFYSGISTSVSFVLRLVTNKIMAVYLGTDGMFLMGQLRDFLKLTQVLNHGGTTNGTISFAARYRDEPDEFKKLLATGFKIHLMCALGVMIFVLVFNKALSTYLFQTTAFSSVIIALGISTVPMSLHLLLMSVINGLKRIRLYISINIIAALFSAAVLIILILKFDIKGALFSYALTQALTFIISLLLTWYYSPFDLKSFFSGFDRSYRNKLFRFSLMALAGPLCLIAATFFVRTYLESEFDRSHAGSWEGMWRISALYLLFLTTTFKFYLIPTFSQLQGPELRQEVFKVWRFIFPVVIVIAGVIYLSRDFVINTLLDKEFYLIGTLIGFHLLGDTIKINSWVLGNILIAKARTKAFIAFQLEWALAFSIFTWIFTKQFGFVGVSIAYLLAYVLHFTLMNIYFGNMLWKRRY